MSKKVLLTGIGGSIGIHTLGHIMHMTDWEVVGIDSFRHKGLTDRLSVTFADHPDWVPRTKIITHDLSAPFSSILKNKIGHIDYIISMASMSDVEDSIKNPVPFIENNVKMILNLLELAREIRPDVFLQISTDEVYGPTRNKNDKYAEWVSNIPSNPYSASKACQENIAIAYWRTYDVPLIITNTMNNFGEMQSPSKFPVIVQKALSNDEEIMIHAGKDNDNSSRSYIHSRNFSDALIFILKNLPPHIHEPGKVDRPDKYHIAGDKQLSNLELAETIAKLMGKKLKYKLIDSYVARPGHDPHYALNDSKLRALGWKPPMSFEESLNNVIIWQSEHPEWIN